MLDVDHGTYPFVTSSNATSGGAAHRLGRRAEPHRPRHRASSRRTRPASAPARSPPSCSTSRASSCAPTRLRVRHHHRPPAPHRLVRRPDRALRGAHQRRHRLRAHQARRAHRPRAASRSASRTTSTACGSTRCRSTRPTSTTRCRLRGVPRLDRGHLRRPRRSRTCRRTRRTTCCALEAMSGSRISAIGVGPGRDADRRAARPARLSRRPQGGAARRRPRPMTSRFASCTPSSRGDRPADHRGEQRHDPSRADQRLEPDDRRAAGCRGPHRVRVVGRHPAHHAAQRRASVPDRPRRSSTCAPCRARRTAARCPPRAAPPRASTRHPASSGAHRTSPSAATTPRRGRRRWPARR